ncbi:hypothetical protein LTR27_001948 [Elasticomyces elasticus]|nr:hypothetical protein LTR27_001948 [Elasticomyces elasticus]
MFSKAQLACQPGERACLSAERRVEICEHKSFTLVDLKDLYMAWKASLGGDVIRGRSNDFPNHKEQDKDPFATIASTDLEDEFYACQHFDFMHHASTLCPSFRELKFGVDGRGKHKVSVLAQFKLGTDVTRAIRPSDHCCSQCRSEAYESLIRKRIKGLAARLCPHASTKDHRIYERFDTAYCMALTAGTNIPRDLIRLACGQPDCTMRFWFSREVVGDERQQGTENFWLHVRHCELPLPMRADNWAWHACSTADETKKIKSSPQWAENQFLKWLGRSKVPKVPKDHLMSKATERTLDKMSKKRAAREV